jgi:beta-lactamase superfamily II metal-dependent hydrolase
MNVTLVWIFQGIYNTKSVYVVINFRGTKVMLFGDILFPQEFKNLCVASLE